MTFRKSIFTLILSSVLFACSSDDNVYPTDKTQVQINAGLSAPTRTNHNGNAFVAGDSFILYEDLPTTGASSKKISSYSFNGTTWSGNPGLFWDDLSIWDSNGVKKTDNIYFTAVLANGGDLDLSASSFTIAKDQSVANNYLKNDLLVADSKAAPLSPLTLTFKHVFARLRFVVTENAADGPAIIGENTTFTLDKAMVGNIITFGCSEKPGDGTVKPTTAVVNGSKDQVKLLRHTADTEKREYTYEIILPAQSLRDATLTLSNNANQKVYKRALENVAIGEEKNTTVDLLVQGNTTTISLFIEKTELFIGEVTVKEWSDTSAGGIATPNDYPTIEIGGKDEGGDDGGLNPDDDYAGKTIKLTSDVTMDDLELPIGTKDVPFRGTFDGQGYTIRGVDISRSDLPFLGVFGYTDGATIKNLNVEITGIANGNQNSSTATGGLAGYINNTSIVNCHVLHKDDVSNASVTAAYDNAGGLVGYVNGVSVIRNSSADVFVSSGHDYAGGLIGIVRKGAHITHSFSVQGAKADNYYAGGLIGACNDADVDYCYSWGNAEASRYAGGLIGRYNNTTKTNHITNSYATGKAEAPANAAGLIGYTEVLPQYCYWNAKSNSGKGYIGLQETGTNSSFTLTTTQAAMGNVLNGLNTDSPSGTVGEEWELEKITDYSGYVLPTLKSNKGKAETIKEE